MEGGCTSETSVYFCEATQNEESCHIHTWRGENLKSHLLQELFYNTCSEADGYNTAMRADVNGKASAVPVPSSRDESV
jgi:hypothetical protein